MPFELQFNRQTKLLHCRVEGKIYKEDLEQALNEIVTSPDYAPDVDTIWDVFEVDLASVDKDLLTAFIDIRERFPQRGEARVAIVGNEDLTFGLARMYSGMSSLMAQKIRVFRDIGSAEDWLMNKQNEQ